MRAKRSKKYRKLMHQYELTFGFREPYQVLVDSNLLRAVHTFKMDLIPALERTLQGKVKPLLTKCSLAATMASQPINPRTNNPYRPDHLPPPTVLPLRHCSHNADSTPIDEVECLLSLLSPSTDVKKNKEHYTLATADPPGAEKALQARIAAQAAGLKRKRGVDEGEAALKKARSLRSGARTIPGVPIVYVKRSVMILEPMSNPSDSIREGVEKGKFRAGLGEKESKKRSAPADGEEREAKKEKKGPKKPKGPNPLSVKKAKKKVEPSSGASKSEKPRPAAGEGEGAERAEEAGELSAPKAKRRRRHNKSGPMMEGEAGAAAPEAMEE